MDDRSQRSEREGVLFDPIEWADDDTEVLHDSEEKLLWAAHIFSKVLIDEMDAYSYFVAGMHNYIEILSDYNNHARELSQMLFALFQTAQQHTEHFLKIVAMNPEMIENMAHDLRRWREHMGENDYSYDKIHKLHEPTMSAIYQMIELLDPEGAPAHDDGEDEIEFF